MSSHNCYTRKVKKLKKLIIFLLIIAPVVYAIYYFLGNSAMGNRNNQNTLSLENARTLAENSLSQFTSAVKPAIMDSYELIDLEGNTTAYLFIVDSYRGRVGYVNVSKSANGELVPNAVVADSNPFIWLQRLINDETVGTKWARNDVAYDFIFLNNKNYYARLTFTEGDTSFSKFYLLSPDGGYEISELDLK